MRGKVFKLQQSNFRAKFYDLSKWILLFLVVSAVQSLYSENADVYLAIPPKNETEKGLLLFGNYPQENIIGYAKYITGSLEIPDTRHFPPNCHKRTYTLIIYK